MDDQRQTASVLTESVSRRPSTNVRPAIRCSFLASPNRGPLAWRSRRIASDSCSLHRKTASGLLRQPCHNSRLIRQQRNWNKLGRPKIVQTQKATALTQSADPPGRGSVQFLRLPSCSLDSQAVRCCPSFGSASPHVRGLRVSKHKVCDNVKHSCSTSKQTACIACTIF